MTEYTQKTELEARSKKHQKNLKNFQKAIDKFGELVYNVVWLVETNRATFSHSTPLEEEI